jgi:hypothetical protein
MTTPELIEELRFWSDAALSATNEHDKDQAVRRLILLAQKAAYALEHGRGD